MSFPASVSANWKLITPQCQDISISKLRTQRMFATSKSTPCSQQLHRHFISQSKNKTNPSLIKAACFYLSYSPALKSAAAPTSWPLINEPGTRAYMRAYIYMDRFSISIRAACLLFIRNIARGEQFGWRLNNSLSFGPTVVLARPHTPPALSAGIVSRCGRNRMLAAPPQSSHRGRANILILLAAALGDDLSLSQRE